MKFKFLIIIITLLNILIPMKSSAEILNNAKFQNLSIDEGLSDEYVTTIFQDIKGYMWIGTKDGLNRYDGKTMKIYNCNAEEEKSLSSTYITDIEQDSNGNIWIGTDHGLDFIEADTDKVLRMKDRKDILNLGNVKITSLLKSSYNEDIMWIGTEDGLIKCDVKRGTMEAFYHEPNNSNSLSNSSITCLEEYGDGSILVGTRQGLNIIDKDSNITYRKGTFFGDKIFIYSILKDDDYIWASTKEGLFFIEIIEDKIDTVYQAINNEVKRYDLNEKSIDIIYEFEDNRVNFYSNDLFKDSEGNIWVSSSSGAIKYSGDRFNGEVYKKSLDKDSISSNVITSIYEDFNGTMWIGTDKGVNVLNENTMFNYEYFDDVKGKNVVSIIEHNNYTWIATKFNGIYIYNSKTGELVEHLYEKDNLSLDDRYIKDMVSINENYILIITNKEIVAYNYKKKIYTERLVGDDYSAELSYAYSDGQNMWLASTSNFYSYNIKSSKRTYYSQDMRDAGINPGRIKYILPDNNDKNIIWLGGVDTGLIKFHKQKGIIANYINDSLDENSLINDYINCMTFDDSGNLWIGTNIGLSKFNMKTKKITSYTTADGLTNNFINSILVDNNGDLWISTNKGLNKFEFDKEEITNFSKMDGLYGYQFNLNSSLKMEDGTLIFGSTDGCAYFNPDDIDGYKSNKRDVVIGDIYLDKNKVAYNGNELVLEHDYKNLNISYFLPRYESLNNINYEYMVEGIDTDWIYINGKNNLDLKSFEPGKYTFKVRARDGHGQLTDEATVNIRVKNPLWKTPLAYVIYATMLFIVFIYIFNYVNILQSLVDQKTMNLNKQLDENKRLSQELIEKEKFKNNYFVNLSHELRTPINIIASTVQLINMLGKNKDKPITQEKLSQYMDIISKSCENLFKIISDIIDSSKIETGKYKITKSNNDIVYIVEEAALNMSKFIEDKGLSLIIDPDMEEKIISCDVTEIERCVINLLGNAVKFTDEGGEIRLYIKEVDGYVEITVEDTGIGISKEDQEFIFKRFSQVDGTGATKVSSSGIGLTLVKYIVELHGGYVRLESVLNEGSKFTIGIPDIVEDVEFNN